MKHHTTRHDSKQRQCDTRSPSPRRLTVTDSNPSSISSGLSSAAWGECAQESNQISGETTIGQQYDGLAGQQDGAGSHTAGADTTAYRNAEIRQQ